MTPKAFLHTYMSYGSWLLTPNKPEPLAKLVYQRAWWFGTTVILASVSQVAHTFQYGCATTDKTVGNICKPTITLQGERWYVKRSKSGNPCCFPHDRSSRFPDPGCYLASLPFDILAIQTGKLQVWSSFLSPGLCSASHPLGHKCFGPGLPSWSVCNLYPRLLFFQR